MNKLHPPQLIQIPLARQATPYTCGVAALQAVLHYYGHAVRQDVLAAALCASPEHGTNYKKMVAYAQACGLTVDVYTELDVAELRSLIDRGIPVMVALQAWAAPGTDYAEAWEDGHYAVVVGHDSAKLYFMDPSTLGNYTYIPVANFLERWHDAYHEEGQLFRVHRLAMAYYGLQPTYLPDVVLPME